MLFSDGSDVAGFVQLPAGARIVQVSEQVSIMPSFNLPSRLLKNWVRSQCERKLSAGKEIWRTLGLAFGRQARQKSGGYHVKPVRRRPALNFAASLWDTAFFRPGRRRVGDEKTTGVAIHTSSSTAC